MIIQRQEDEIVFRGVDSFFEELLRQLPESALPGDAASRARIFTPLTGGRDREADAEWQELNEPELRELFKSHLDVVADDLKNLTGEEDDRSVSFPLNHVPAWIHTLNQARLAIAARYGFTEDDIEGRVDVSPKKAVILRQIEIYAELLGFLLQHTDL